MSATRPADRKTIREARESAGLSQVQVAFSLGVSEPTYRKYERQPELMSLMMARRLAATLDVDFTDLALYDPNVSGVDR